MEMRRKDSSDVVNAIVRRDRPLSRVGVFDYVWSETLTKWVDHEGYPVDEQGNPVSPEEVFGFDMMGAGGWIQAFPRYGPDAEEVLEETDEWVVKRNGAGAAMKTWKHRSGTPEHMDFHMTSRRIWDQTYRPLLLEVDRDRFDVDGTREKLARSRKQGYWAYHGLMFLCEMMRSSMGDVCMLESMLLDPDWIRDYGRVYTDLYKGCYKVLFEEAGTPDGIWIYEDLGYRNGLFCSPKLLGSLLVPYYAEIVEFFHSYDVPVILHSCGRITEALPLMVDAGFDGLHPMEAKAGCDVLAFAETYGEKLAFVGGLDIRTLESGDRDLIRSEVTALVEGMTSRGARYVFGSDHSISTGVALADLKFAHDVYREHMDYPQ
ncbi:MAG: uroporphyrinogen decarboxylase family protein [Planctomycetota bacterium]|jgi:uroporphyrinogen decarboxylase